jgi:hypothetical protein
MPGHKFIIYEHMPYRHAVAFAAAAALATSLATQTPGEVRRAVPVNAIDGILAAFETHGIVALPDAHGSGRTHAFLLSLIRDPRFVRTVDDIVVEFGNAGYQDVADRFVRGEDVPLEALCPVWRDHTQPSIAADFTHHEDFFRAVRAVNTAAAGGRTLRVLLGDPPIDWSAVTNRDEHFRWIQMREAHPAAVMQTQVIARMRRALLVYGTGHLQRRQVMSNFEMDDWRAQTIVSLLERAGPTRIFTIAGVNDRHVKGWTPPAIATIRGTELGAVDASAYFGPGHRFGIVDGRLVPIDKDRWRQLRAEDQFDALLYLGPAINETDPLSKKLCDEPGYVEMRLKRIAIAALPPAEVERVHALCEA